MSFPIITQIVHLSQRCNLNCSYCYIKQKHTVSFTKESLKKQIAFVDARYHEIAGTEPFMEALDLFEELYERKIDRLDIAPYIITNATLLTDKHLDFIQRNKIKLGISIDGPEIVHNDQRGSFKEVMNGIRRCVSRGIPIRLLSTLYPRNYDKIFEIFLFFFNLFKELYSGDTVEEMLNKLVTCSISPFDTPDTSKLSDSDIDTFLEQYCKIADYIWSLDILEKEKNSFLRRYLLREKPKGCEVIHKGAKTILVDGSIHPCFLTPGTRVQNEFQIGSLEKGFTNIKYFNLFYHIQKYWEKHNSTPHYIYEYCIIKNALIESPSYHLTDAKINILEIEYLRLVEWLLSKSESKGKTE